MIPYGHQDVSERDIAAVVSVLRSDFITQGPVVPRFEQAVARRCGAKHGIAVNSGTAALHIACMALDVKPGDTLWTVPNTFVASANCALYCGASVDFVDIDPATWNMSVPALRAKLAAARETGTLPKVVVPVHFAGQPTDQEAIWELAQEFGFKVIEDAAHSLGATRGAEPVGSCKWSHITIFSFHPVKIITTAEGGLATTNDDELAWRMATLRTHGITREADRMVDAAGGAWRYEQLMLGYNYRMTELQAALGASQLERLDEFVSARNAVAEEYGRRLAGLPLQLPAIEAANRCAFHLYVVRVSGATDARHAAVFDELRAAGVGVNVHYTPVYLQPYYRGLGFEQGLCPEAERYAHEAITLPLYAGLTVEKVAYVADAVAAALEKTTQRRT